MTDCCCNNIECTTCHASCDAATKQLREERDAARAWRNCADMLADEVAALVRNRVIDSRSPAADALLDYRDPPSTPRADALVALRADLATAMEALESAEDETRPRLLPHDWKQTAKDVQATVRAALATIRARGSKT